MKGQEKKCKPINMMKIIKNHLSIEKKHNSDKEIKSEKTKKTLKRPNQVCSWVKNEKSLSLE